MSDEIGRPGIAIEEASPFVPVRLAIFLGFARTSKSMGFSNQGI
jgi:hypothetical protein